MGRSEREQIMALNFRQAGPANVVKAALDALDGLTADEQNCRGNASEALASHGADDVDIIVQASGWRIIPKAAASEVAPEA